MISLIRRPRHHLKFQLQLFGQYRTVPSGANDLDMFDSLAEKELHKISELVEERAEKIDLDSLEFNEGVVTIAFTSGVFVLNKHSASRQIWYSSPVSSPAYFELLGGNGTPWWSSRVGMTLREKLKADILKLTGQILY